MNAAFDVGADDGFHGILFAFFNPKIKIYAFEPIRGSKKRILKNLKKIEKFFNVKINNYKIINSAISDYNGYTNFYETHYRVGSSLLKPKKKLNKIWSHSKDYLIKTIGQGIKMKKKYKVKVQTLETICKKNSISKINYLHIDAQGNDLRVIDGLKNFKNYVESGVVEVAKNNKVKIYNREQSYKDLKKKFKKWRFIITKIEEVQKNHPGINVYFKSVNEIANKEYNIKFIYPTKRFERMFRRIFSGKTNIKDIIFLMFWKLRLN
tara:strand:+ start:11107 stop:11901 length:795 start_codon:yes stop_codon:yes gene_type:complete